MDLYSEIILDYYKNPRNKGPLKDANAYSEEYNPSCGDKISIQLKIEDNKITKANFDGIGCAISQATTSMLTEEIIGKTIEEIKAMDTPDIINMLGIEISPGRIKCALLGLSTIKKAIILHKHA
ncbi:SUF system NifU family Fe-S cluster assembly protein [Candidatus Peregrinibacteria bacterium CG10_big_fil_rev_8_21_14_0_10_36_19]|nr:MAG: SUF system NifU family Fe-S cluster assembly protein [Candidatus Peregrinibacteria bacterium CG10_big_fil_rev_8_21_14_0_10_36_19]